ncbi:MspA family porin, partial [Corynebacterium kalidii]
MTFTTETATPTARRTRRRPARTIATAAASIAAATTLAITAIAPATAAPTLPWPAPVTGGPTDLPDRQISRTTADGWVLHASKTGESVNIAGPLDASATTGEAFGTLTGNVWIDGDGAPELTGAMFDAGYQIGCGVDVSGGVDVELAGTAGIAPHADAGIEGGPSVQV